MYVKDKNVSVQYLLNQNVKQCLTYLFTRNLFLLKFFLNPSTEFAAGNKTDLNGTAILSIVLK